MRSRLLYLIVFVLALGSLVWVLVSSTDQLFLRDTKKNIINDLAPNSVPSGIPYVVQPGDTLYRIAEKFGITPWSISRANGISLNRVYVGQQLIIPATNQASRDFLRSLVENGKIEVEWPPRMVMGRENWIRIALSTETEDDLITPTIRAAEREYTATIATPIPVGTHDAQIESNSEAAYTACIAAQLEPGTFEILTEADRCWSLDQPRVTWEWVIAPQEPEERHVVAEVLIRWTPTTDDVPDNPPSQIWHDRLDIFVHASGIRIDARTVILTVSLIVAVLILVFREYRKPKTGSFASTKLEKGERAGKLARIIPDCYNLEEFRTLCFALSVDFDDLGGEGKSGKARELVALMQRRGRLEDLVEKLCEQHPDLVKDIGPQE